MAGGTRDRGIPPYLARGILKRAFRGIPPRGIPAILRGVYHLDFGARGTWRGGYTTYFRARGILGTPLGGGYMSNFSD